MKPPLRSREAIRVALNSGADRRWLGAYLDLPNRLTFAIDDAKTRFFKADVQPNVMLSIGALLCGNDVQIVAPGSGFRHRPAIGMHWSLEARLEEPSPDRLLYPSENSCMSSL